MTIFENAPNRAHWERTAAGDTTTPWEELTADLDKIEEQWVDGDLWLRPSTSSTDGTLLAIHGGGFVGGSVTSHRKLFGHIAGAAGAAAYAANCGLVPDHVYPSQLDTATRIYRHLADQGPVALVGDSAGGTLALGVALRARADNLPRPRGLYLISPWTDMEASGASYDKNTDPFFARDMVRQLATAYLAGTSPQDPFASPLHADHRDLPPVYIQVGAEEALLDDSRELAKRMRAAGVDVQLEVYPNQLHTFQMTAGNSAVADEAIRKAGTWLRSTLSR